MVLCSHLLGGSYMMKHGGHWSVQLRNNAKGKLSASVLLEVRIASAQQEREI
jgi:hypothetical protein